MKINNPGLKNLLMQYGYRRDHHGEHPHELLNGEDFSKIEKGLNEEIDEAEDGEMDKLIHLRYMFRIAHKFAEDIMRGESILQEYYNEHEEEL